MELVVAMTYGKALFDAAKELNKLKVIEDQVTQIDQILKKDNMKGTSVKIFSNLKKYTDRLEQLKELDTEETLNQSIMNTLKSVSL